MSSLLEQLQEKIDGRTLRERVILFLTVLAVVYLLWSLLVQSHVDAQRDNLRAEIERVALERKAIDAQLTAFALAAATDPALQKKAEIDALKQQISEVQTQLSSMSQGLISAQDLPKILQEVLRRTASVNLLSVQTLPTSELTLTTLNPAAPDAPELQGAGVYKHVVLLKVSGNYAQLIALLTAIESLTWKFYWERLDYEVTHYPRAEILIRVFTLSSDEGLLGV